MDNNNKQIKPAALKLSQHDQEDDNTPAAASGLRINRFAVMAITAILLSILLLIVLLYLPAGEPIKPEETIATNTITTEQRTSPLTITKHLESSPWDEAQKKQLRLQTQETLAEMLKAQQTLKDAGVTQWAEQTYNNYLQLAESGDNHYREQRFNEAQENYEQAQQASMS